MGIGRVGQGKRVGKKSEGMKEGEKKCCGIKCRAAEAAGREIHLGKKCIEWQRCERGGHLGPVLIGPVGDWVDSGGINNQLSLVVERSHVPTPRPPKPIPETHPNWQAVSQ